MDINELTKMPYTEITSGGASQYLYANATASLRKRIPREEDNKKTLINTAKLNFGINMIEGQTQAQANWMATKDIDFLIKNPTYLSDLGKNTPYGTGSGSTDPSLSGLSRSILASLMCFPVEKDKVQPSDRGFISTGGYYGAPRRGHTHTGNDIMAPTGTKLYAICSGTITHAAYQGVSAGYGNRMDITMDGYPQYSFRYGHCGNEAPMDGIFVQKGQHVTVGQEIGYVGHSGNADEDAPHLHFDFLINGQFTDPYPLLDALWNNDVQALASVLGIEITDTSVTGGTAPDGSRIAIGHSFQSSMNEETQASQIASLVVDKLSAFLSNSEVKLFDRATVSPSDEGNPTESTTYSGMTTSTVNAVSSWGATCTVYIHRNASSGGGTLTLYAEQTADGQAYDNKNLAQSLCNAMANGVPIRSLGLAIRNPGPNGVGVLSLAKCTTALVECGDMEVELDNSISFDVYAAAVAQGIINYLNTG